MATSKKSVTKKAAAPKKAATKSAAPAAPAAPAVKKSTAIEGPVVLNKKQEQSIVMIGKNQERILKDAVHMLDIAFDSGERLLELKDQIKAKYKLGWKEWAEQAAEDGILRISYSQVTRYMALARDPKLFAQAKALGTTSIEDTVKQIGYIKKPEKQQADEDKATAKAAAPKAAGKSAPVTLNYAFDVINQLDLEDLRAIQTFIADRIDELVDASNEDAIPGTATEIDDDDTATEDAADAAEAVGENVDPIS